MNTALQGAYKEQKMAKTTTMKKRHNRTPVKDRKKYPYLVFQIERGLRAKLRLKTKKLGTSMSAFVEDLVKKAV